MVEQRHSIDYLQIQKIRRNEELYQKGLTIDQVIGEKKKKELHKLIKSSNFNPLEKAEAVKQYSEHLEGKVKKEEKIAKINMESIEDDVHKSYQIQEMYLESINAKLDLLDSF